MRPSKPLLAALLVLVAALPVCAKKEKKKDAPAAAPAGVATSTSSNPDEVVAYIGSETITRADLEKEAAAKLAQVRQQEYDIRRTILEKMIQDKIYAKEAAARNMSVEDLIRVEVDEKIPQSTTEEINKFYEENRNRMGGRTLEQVSNDIRNFLSQQKGQGRRREFFEEMMAKEKASVVLDPPRVAVSIRDNDPARGPKDAPVTIVEFSDFQCPFCKRAHAVVEDVMKAYGERVRLVYLDYPLQFHPQAIPAAEAAYCAGDQGKYWEYHSNLMTVEGSLMDDDLKKRAGEVGLDMAAFNSCIEGTAHDATIKANFDQGAALGVTGTPTFFINGRMLVGARPMEEIKAVVDEELARHARKSS